MKTQTRFGKYRELLTDARRHESNARKSRNNPNAYWTLRAKAEIARARAEWMACRITTDEMDRRIGEAMDAIANPV